MSAKNIPNKGTKSPEYQQQQHKVQTIARGKAKPTTTQSTNYSTWERETNNNNNTKYKL
jgi:hypothetical protein